MHMLFEKINVLGRLSRQLSLARHRPGGIVWTRGCVLLRYVSAYCTYTSFPFMRHLTHLPGGHAEHLQQSTPQSPPPPPVSAWESILPHPAASFFKKTTSTGGPLSSRSFSLSLAGVSRVKTKASRIPLNLFFQFPVPQAGLLHSTQTRAAAQFTQYSVELFFNRAFFCCCTQHQQ